MQITSWRGKRIVISGSSGFIGAHLLRYFQEKGARVLGLSRNPKTTKFERRADVADFHAMSEIITEFRPDAFFHLAGEAIVESGQEHPYRTFHTNIVSTLNVLEAARVAKISRIIIASTVHVYGDSPTPFKEDEPARPSRPYETSKTCTDLIAQSYADTYGLPVLIPRFVNIYGPGDTNLTRIIPKTITAILRGDEPTMWGGGKATRDYLYIDDAVRAYDLLGKISDAQITRNRIFNFGTGKAFSARDVIVRIAKFMGHDGKIQTIDDGRESELLRQEVSFAKAQSVLGWIAKTEFSDGLKKTIDWYKQSGLR